MKFIRLFPFLLIFLFAACSTKEQVHSTKEHLVISKQKHHEDKEDQLLYIEAKTLHSKTLFLPPITIIQEIKELKNSKYLIYEHAKCSSGYIFDGSISKIVNTIFQPDSKSLIVQHGNYYFFQLRYKGLYYNLFVHNRNKKAIDFIYPIDSISFISLIENITKQKVKKELHFATIKPKLLTQWSHKLIILDGVVKKVGGKVRGK